MTTLETQKAESSAELGGVWKGILLSKPHFAWLRQKRDLTKDSASKIVELLIQAEIEREASAINSAHTTGS